MEPEKRPFVTEDGGSSNSPLLKLPGELRNRIYELVFENDSETIDIADAFFEDADSSSDPTVTLRKASAAPPSLGLMLCCKSTYAESKQLFASAASRYWNKTFTIKLRDLELFERIVESAPARLTKSRIIVTTRISTTKIMKVSWIPGKRWQSSSFRLEDSVLDCDDSWRGQTPEIISCAHLAHQLVRILSECRHKMTRQ